MSAEDPKHFEISCRRIDASTVVVAPGGSLDLESAPELKRILFDLLGAGRSRLVLDFSGVSFIDSTALGVLIGLKRNLAWPESMAIAAPSEEVIKLLELTGIMRVFALYPTVEAAVSSLPRASSRDRGPDLAPGVDLDEGSTNVLEGPAGADGVAGAPLTPDAAMVLGMAATAMPFARSVAEQAERWLQILRGCGDAGAVLASLGMAEGAGEPSSELAQQRPRGFDASVDHDPVAKVTRCAELTAHRRGATGIRASDLLQAVMTVYGAEFEQVLLLHGVESADVIKRLDELQRDS